MKPADMETYPSAIMAAQRALERFEEHGHGAFLWQAYQSVRAAAQEFPAYRAALIPIIDEMEAAKRNPALAADAAKLEEDLDFLDVACRTTAADRVTDKFLRELTERILRHLDTIAADVLQVKGTSSQPGAASLRKAMRMNDQLNPISADARASEEAIIDEFSISVRLLARNQSQFGAPHVVWSFTRLRDNVAVACGVSGKHVGSVIRRYLERDPEEKKLLDEVLASARTLKPKKPTNTTTRKKKRKPAKPAAWRE